MGQRLNIEIVAGDEILANAYYHWSADTSSAIRLANEVIDHLCKHQSKHTTELRSLAIDALHVTGAGFSQIELHDIQESMPTYYEKAKGMPAIDRDEGLISITPKHINETKYWADGNVIIDIVGGSVDFDLAFEIDPDVFMTDHDGIGVEDWISTHGCLCVDISQWMDNGYLVLNIENFAEFGEAVSAEHGYVADFLTVKGVPVLQTIQ